MMALFAPTPHLGSYEVCLSSVSSRSHGWWRSFRPDPLTSLVLL